jgi:Flp pilus assembly protein TadG
VRRTVIPAGGRRHWLRGDRGAALVELAVTLPLLVVVLVGITDFGRAFRTAMVVVNAARAGAQYGSQSQSSSTDTAGMITKANEVLSANGLTTGPTPVAARSCECATNAGVYTPTTPVNTCSATCTGGHIVISVNVSVTRTFSMLTPFPGLPDSVTVIRNATARAK